jgi:hypothetical protein
MIIICKFPFYLLTKFINIFTLTITKALYEKLEATKRNLKVDYKYTNGGIVLTADAVTFELLGLATLNYFANLPNIIGQANIRKITDKSQATIVQHIIKVILNNASYTINIYNTTSRLLVNSNGANHVIAKDIPLANDNDLADSLYFINLLVADFQHFGFFFQKLLSIGVTLCAPL